MKKMNSKQRVNITLSHKEPDRVPVDYWADPIVTKKLMDRIGCADKDELLKKLGIDFRFIEGSIFTGPVQPVSDDGSKSDIWGVRRKSVMIDQDDPGKGSYEHVTGHPLAFAESVSDIEDYKGWPETVWYDFSKVAEQCDAYSEYSVVCGGDRLNRTAQLKPAMYLRGVEQIMVDLALNEDIVEAIFKKLVDFYLDYNKKIFENASGKIDIFFMGDDFGTQNGLMMSMEMWRKFVKPGFRKFIDLAHSYEIKVMHHTCGAIYELIPEFIDCGLDILQSLQPGARGMDLSRIKKEYGKDICFQGGIDIQHTMPYGTPEDVENEVRRTLDIMSPGGGYILCSAHNLQADVPAGNALALFETARRYGCVNNKDKDFRL
ncbi:MAG: uroporphyrinogen decarboxylase family protein [Saccharofermentanales bacterium]